MHENHIKSTFVAMQAAIQQKQSVDVMTLLSSAGETQMLLLYKTGDVVGEIINLAFTNQIRAYQESHIWQKPILLTMLDEQGVSQQIFWDRILPAPKVLVLGAGHISRSLSSILSILEYEVIIADDRPDFANVWSFPTAQVVLCDSFENIISQLKPTVDVNTAVVIVTRGHRYDFLCLKNFLNTNFGYLGMIGSKSRVRGTIQRLVEEGEDSALLAKIHSPIGIAIAAQSPAEIAVSIAAELIDVFNGGHGPLKRLEV
jgi:xanthine dehydrogenase accessory factor